ncbi:lipid A deacylase LpxR family protein [Parvibaculum sp.]|uniref:lipid A deacylase LpxR family protein n=1 Tax=Parvibaculum sp. TaxID=2024848 RepID=UPI001B24BE7C|nr:lipid A deacylase LpxR family protein [Parvibaculum sp.]MBO6666837.1 lipid A deacylase LpxR family protein [Parvibaculum sp.]MBO6691645.1 lipid A deacylase LpxR family protein [Parvibaculum sp.]MBO6713458.1 lipid A deacylase LpxR family protein [Parvibaculum sp.]
MRRGFAASFLAVLTMFGGGAAARADNFAGGDREFLTLQSENDLFANLTNTDRHYTNGLQAAWLSRPQTDLPVWLTDFSSPPVYSLLFPTGNFDKKSHRIGVALGHAIFTPDDTQTTAYQPNERPYAAWLHMTFSLQSVRASSVTGEAWQDQWKLDLGVVGPAAQGEFVQNNWHKLIGAEEANGWRWQIQDEIGVNLSFERAWRSSTFDTPRVAGLQTDFIPYTIVSLGNVQTYAGLGGTLRLGFSLPDDFGPTRVYPGVGGAEWFEPSAEGCNCYVFAGFEGRAVGRDITLDGNTFRDSPSIDKRHFVYDAKLGAVFIVWDTRISFTHVFRSREYEGQPKPDQFGSVAVNFAF